MSLRPADVPDRVGKLAAANRTLVSSLEQAHSDLAGGESIPTSRVSVTS